MEWLGDKAFSACSSLEYIEIPDTVKSIDYNEFGGCNIKNIKLPSELTRLERDIFVRSSLGEMVIPANVTYIGNSTFSNCHD